jgi:hypothetical protein
MTALTNPEDRGRLTGAFSFLLLFVGLLMSIGVVWLQLGGRLSW